MKVLDTELRVIPSPLKVGNEAQGRVALMLDIIGFEDKVASCAHSITIQPRNKVHMKLRLDKEGQARRIGIPWWLRRER